ncbi:MAG: hypothetical protein HY017_09960 [Betaproteobacteria bacterium]|nr:hypothetical protein [Betaproteobacteria bacterium]
MSPTLNAVGSRYDRVTIPTIWVAFALSLILHAVALWGWLPKVFVLPFEDPKQGKPSGSLSVRLAPPPAPAMQAQRAPAQRTSPPKAEPQRPSAPRVLALERPSPSTATPPPAETASPPPAAMRPPAFDDLASYIEARRRSREPVPAPPPSQGSPPVPQPAETEKERHNRIVAANLGLNRTPSFGAEREHGGGIFQIHRMGYSDAEFLFFGWNKFINRNAQQMIEVRRGDNATIEIAVVRRMIAIIREHESGDFVWQSQRLGRDLKLSARMSDNAGLEEVMMREFFPDYRSR